MKTTLQYKGYTIEIEQDQDAENPFESWDCESALLTLSGNRFREQNAYNGAPESIGDVVRLMPDSCFKRGERVKLIKAMLNCSMREFAEMMRDYSSTRDAFAEFCEEQVGQTPHGWGDAIEWFEMAESLLKWAGIECLNTQSNGYSQGDSTLVLAIATPEWIAKVGAPAESLQDQLQGAVDLYGAWAWGDVYGVSTITAPGSNGVCAECDVEWSDGEELSFYGRDHEQSGLMEHARSIIDAHIAEQQETALNAPACLI